jgi:putative bacteriocin precursor
MGEEGGEIMKALGKKIYNITETVEAYCISCSYCGCGCSCARCGYGGYTLVDAVYLSGYSAGQNTNSLTNNGQYAAVG